MPVKAIYITECLQICYLQI